MSDSVEPNLALWREYAPKIAEAYSRDRASKEEIFLEWFEESICGIPCVQLTPKKYLLLSVSNALVNEEMPTFNSVLRFLWILSPNFKESKLAFKWFCWKNRKVDPEESVKECAKYLERAFRFQPSSKMNESGSAGKDWVSSLCDTICSEYGWSLKEVLNTPITILFLLCTRIRSRYTGKPINFSSEADKLKSEYLKKVNEVA